MSHLENLAALVEGTNEFPQAAIERAKLALIDYVGVATAGSVEPVSKIVTAYVRRRANGTASIIGASFRTHAADAALANATTGHALDFDDSNFVLGGHPTVTIMPAVLALAQECGSSGREVLEAYVVGFEAMMKLSRAVNFEHYEKGWHPTATMGVFGTAAAASRLMRLPLDKIQHALALAASMASGVKANFGAMSKPFQVGHAAEKGVTCAQLAAHGLTASPSALEGKQGFFDVYNGAGHYRLEELSARSDTLEILRSGFAFKKYPCCGATHAPIDAARDLVRANPLPRGEVESITIAMNKRRTTHVDRPVVTDGLQGKFSIQYTLAAALADGGVGLRHFTDAALAREDLKDLTARVHVVGVEGAADLSQACELTVKLKNGTTRFARRDDADGRTADHYPSYMAAKFTDCVEQAFDGGRAGPLLAQLKAFDACASVNEIMRSLERVGV